VVQIEHEPIQVLDVFPPPFCIKHDTKIKDALFEKDKQNLLSTAKEVYDVVLQKLNQILNESVVEERADAEALISSTQKERDKFFQIIEGCKVDIPFELNKFKRYFFFTLIIFFSLYIFIKKKYI
jgi:hypothetical protein